VKVSAVFSFRYGATRFPGKPLVNILGKSMIQRFWKAIRIARGLIKL
jgi:3-deoxy-manno-octulosonate cytidylyltransferase (CMP-KDO synthetase)